MTVIRHQFIVSPHLPFAQKLVYSSCHAWKWSPWSDIFCLFIKFCNSHAVCYSYVSQRWLVWSCHAATTESLAWQLHDGSTVIANCWYGLDDHVMASVCVCVCIQHVYSLAYERREVIGGADEGEQVWLQQCQLSFQNCVTTSVHHFLSWSPTVT